MAVVRMLLILTASAVFALGLVMIFSTSSAEILDHDLVAHPLSFDEEVDPATHQALFKQLLYAVMGCSLGLFLIKIGYRSLLTYSKPLLVFFTLLLLLALLPGIGREVNGSRRWLNLAGFSFQPSEFVKYIIPCYFLSFALSYEKLTLKPFLKGLCHIAIPIVLILIEPNNGTTAVIILAMLTLFLLMQLPFHYWAWPLACCLIIGGGFASQLPYVQGRIKSYLHPELDLRGKGHQPHQAKIAAGSGKLWGRGPGNGLQKLSYLPEAQNDYIAAIFAEEFGFMGIMSLITLYLLMAVEGCCIALYCHDRQGFLLAAYVTFLLTFQAFLNLGVVSGIVPSTGLNLPLFSQGGSSLMANMAGVALLLSISRDSRCPVPLLQPDVNNTALQV